MPHKDRYMPRCYTNTLKEGVQRRYMSESAANCERKSWRDRFRRL
jgi:hypothetical protein